MTAQSVRIWIVLLTTMFLISSSWIQINVCNAACIQPIKDGRNCPDSCVCIETDNSDHYELKIDCSRGGLIQIPDIPINTIDLRLDSNKVQTIKQDDFKGCSSLKYLSLSINDLISINQGSFDELVNLEELYLNDNQLSLNMSSSKMLFSQLHSLKTLSIHRNTLIPEELLSNLTTLKRLTIDRSMKTLQFKSFFLNFHKLSTLELYGTFQIMPNETFKYFVNAPLREIKILALNGGKESTITDIQPLAFSKLTHLEVLDLSGNRGIGFGNASNAVYGLCRSAPLTTLVLSRIVPRVDTAAELTTDFYKHLGNCEKLTKLCLDKNNIVTVAPGFAKELPNLEYLDVSYNRMSNVLYVFVELLLMKKLKYLDYSYQNNRYVPSAVRKRSATYLNGNITKYNSSYHEEIEISPFSQGGKISKESQEARECWGTFTPCRYPSIFDFAQSRTFKPIPLADDSTWCIPIPNQLEVINATSSLNVELSRLPTIILLTGFKSKLRHLSYESNGLKQMIGPLLLGRSRQSQPLTFDLAGNGISCIAPNVKKQSKTIGGNVGKMILERNNLGDQLAKDVSGRTFEQLKDDNLTVLNLASNNIKTLQPSTFIHLSVIQELNLSTNSLRKIEFGFSHIKGLKNLDLSYNLISSLDEPTLSYLGKMFQANNLTLHLSGNPIQCSCDTLSFLKWVGANEENIREFDQISCFINNTQLAFNQLSLEILPLLKFQCATKLMLKLSVALLGGTVFIIALSVFLYRHRWDIRYLILSFRSKVPISNEIYDFDAFVSYDHRDMQFVSQLVERLENTFGAETQPFDSALIDSTGSYCNENLEGAMTSDDDDECLALIDQPLSRDPLELNTLRCNNFKLCVAQRDFPAGGGIEENILLAIQKSRKVILVLSKSFLRSKWCNFELEMSRVESVNRGFNILVPVMLETLDIKDMSICLKWLVRQMTYLEWSENEVNREEFWKNLVRVLRKPGRELWDDNSRDV